MHFGVCYLCARSMRYAIPEVSRNRTGVAATDLVRSSLWPLFDWQMCVHVVVFCIRNDARMSSRSPHIYVCVTCELDGVHPPKMEYGQTRGELIRGGQCASCDWPEFRNVSVLMSSETMSHNIRKSVVQFNTNYVFKGNSAALFSGHDNVIGAIALPHLNKSLVSAL